MRRLAFLAAIALVTSSCARNSDQGSLDQQIHKICLKAQDYVGCVKAQTTAKLKNPNPPLLKEEIQSIGNSCPEDFAYVGAGACQLVVCNDDFSHENILRGKGWSCKNRKGIRSFINVSLVTFGPPVEAKLDRRCPLEEPERGRRNSCQNGLSEQQIFESTNPLIKGDTPTKRGLPMACKNGVWDKDHPKCQLPEENIPSPMDMD